MYYSETTPYEWVDFETEWRLMKLDCTVHWNNIRSEIMGNNNWRVKMNENGMCPCDDADWRKYWAEMKISARGERQKNADWIEKAAERSSKVTTQSEEIIREKMAFLPQFTAKLQITVAWHSAKRYTISILFREKWYVNEKYVNEGATLSAMITLPKRAILLFHNHSSSSSWRLLTMALMLPAISPSIFRVSPFFALLLITLDNEPAVDIHEDGLGFINS